MDRRYYVLSELDFSQGSKQVLVFGVGSERDRAVALYLRWKAGAESVGRRMFELSSGVGPMKKGQLYRVAVNNANQIIHLQEISTP